MVGKSDTNEEDLTRQERGSKCFLLRQKWLPMEWLGVHLSRRERLLYDWDGAGIMFQQKRKALREVMKEQHDQAEGEIKLVELWSR